MPRFDDDRQSKIAKSLYSKEEEVLVQTLANTKYHIPYIDLTKIMVENAALSVVPESIARAIGLAPFEIKGKEGGCGIFGKTATKRFYS
jgi:hypothetical protein